MDIQKRSQREKFPEPRGWAMNWVFAQELEAQAAEMEGKSGAGAREKFGEPRGWAAKWDGFALSAGGEPQSERTEAKV